MEGSTRTLRQKDIRNLCGGGDGGWVELWRVYSEIVTFRQVKTRPDLVPELGDSFLIARVRTLCFKSLFMPA